MLATDDDVDHLEREAAYAKSQAEKALAALRSVERAHAIVLRLLNRQQ